MSQRIEQFQNVHDRYQHGSDFDNYFKVFLVKNILDDLTNDHNSHELKYNMFTSIRTLLKIKG